MEKIDTKSLLIGDAPIEDGEVYQLWVAYHPEIGMPSYAVYNKLHNVIEHFQPNFINACGVRDEFITWYANRAKGDNTQQVLNEFGDVGSETH